MSNYYTTFTTPLGIVTLTGDGEYLTGLYLKAMSVNGVQDAKPLKNVIEQLRAYLAGELKAFDLPLSQPGTAFQQSVWKQLAKIPYGKTCSYKDIAAKLKNPNAMRAVGSANGKNRIAIIVPCHRVIAASGGLGGYGYGLDAKKFLLNLERSG